MKGEQQGGMGPGRTGKHGTCEVERASSNKPAGAGEVSACWGATRVANIPGLAWSLLELSVITRQLLKVIWEILNKIF